MEREEAWRGSGDRDDALETIIPPSLDVLEEKYPPIPNLLGYLSR